MTRGEIWWVDLGLPYGSEPGFRRPIIVIQDDSYNKSKIRTVIVVPLTTNTLLGEAPGNVFLHKRETKLNKDSIAVVSQIIAIDKERLIDKVSKISNQILEQIENGILQVLGIRNS